MTTTNTMTDQFPDATKMVLSRAAQTVLDAMYAVNLDFNGKNFILAAAAALLAAADRVVPSETASLSKWPQRHEIRRQLLAIAAELKEAAQ